MLLVIVIAYLKYGVIFILANAVVSMKLQVDLTQGMVCQEVVKVADNCVGPLPCVHCLIYKEVYLPWYPLTADPKYATLPGCFEVHGAWLEGIVWIVDLLGIVKGVVKAEWTLPRWNRAIR